MSAVASTIFKIRAHSDFITPDSHPMLLSFRKGQPFYALSADYEKGYYFVSTQFAVPFSRKAVTGMVPIDKFDKVDLFSKEVTANQRKKSVTSKAGEPEAPQIMENANSSTSVKKRNAPLTAVTSINVLSITESSSGFAYCFKVVRGIETYYLVRGVSEVENFKSYISQAIPSLKQPNMAFRSQDELIRAQDHFFKLLVENSTEINSQIFQALQAFFAPSKESASGLGLYKRRDSGFSRDEKSKNEPKATKPASFGAKISMFVFGH